MKNKNFGRKRQAIYILSNRKSTRIIKTLMDFFFFIKVKIKMVCFSVPSQKPLGYISEFNILIKDYDYSMIVATRPDPTVRPPSRYQTGVLRCTNDDFSCDLWGKVRIFHCIRVVFGDFVIMVLSLTHLL